MLDFLKNKLTIYFAIFGAGLSFVIGIISGIGVIWIIVRVLVSAVVMGLIAVGIQFLVKKYMPEDEVKKLFVKTEETESNEAELPTRHNDKPTIDITDDSQMTPEEILQNTVLEDVDSVKTEAGLSSITTDTEVSQDIPLENASEQAKEQTNEQHPAFEETSFDDSPRVYVHEDNQNIDSSYNDNSIDKNTDDVVANELNKLKERTKQQNKNNSVVKAASGNSGEASFNIGNKRIHADPELIAKAIKTIVHRDR